MSFDRSFGGAQLASDLLVHLAPRHPFKDLSLAGAEAANQCAQMVKLLMLIPHRTEASESTLDCLNQRVLCGNTYRAAPVYAEPDQTGVDDIAYCVQRFRSYDGKSGTYLGYDGQRHPCLTVK
jgi:hypothetical protein